MKYLNILPALAKRAVVLAAAAAVGLGAASANVITIGGGTATITCTPDCEAIVGGSIDPAALGSLSSTDADLYDVTPSDPASEAAALNALAGTSFDGTDGMTTDTGGASDVTFDTMAAWLVLKIGAGTFFVHNIGDGLMTLNIVFDQASGPAGAGGGLSHYTEFGGSEIPIPGAIWLMIAGIAGLGAASRKKKAA